MGLGGVAVVALRLWAGSGVAPWEMAAIGDFKIPDSGKNDFSLGDVMVMSGLLACLRVDNASRTALKLLFLIPPVAKGEGSCDGCEPIN